MSAAIVDTGRLVALLDRAERHRKWASDRIAELEAPLLVCEPVLAEAMFLLARLSARRMSCAGFWKTARSGSACASMNTSPSCVACFGTVETDRCGSRTRASCEWPNCTTGTPCSRSTPISQCIASTAVPLLLLGQSGTRCAISRPTISGQIGQASSPAGRRRRHRDAGRLQRRDLRPPCPCRRR